MKKKNLALVLLTALLTITPSVFATIIQCPTINSEDAKNWNFKMWSPTFNGYFTYDAPSPYTPPAATIEGYGPVKNVVFAFTTVKAKVDPETTVLKCIGTYSLDVPNAHNFTDLLLHIFSRELYTARTLHVSGKKITAKRSISASEYKFCKPRAESLSFECFA